MAVQSSLQGHINLAHMTAQIKMLDANPSQSKLPRILSTIVVEFLVSGALALSGGVCYCCAIAACLFSSVLSTC